MKKSFFFELARNLSAATTMMLLSGCMLVAHNFEKDSYYSYTGKRPDKIITSRKYESAQGIIGASSANYCSIILHLEKYLALTKDKYQYINFIQSSINLPPNLVAEKLEGVKKANSLAFVEIVSIFTTIKKEIPADLIAKEYANASVLRSEIKQMKVGLEEDMLSKQQVISDLNYQNLYAVSAAEFLNKQCILANSPEIQAVAK